MLGAPFRAWPAHVVQFGPVGVEQGFDQVAGEVGKIAHWSTPNRSIKDEGMVDKFRRRQILRIHHEL